MLGGNTIFTTFSKGFILIQITLFEEHFVNLNWRVFIGKKIYFSEYPYEIVLGDMTYDIKGKWDFFFHGALRANALRSADQI